MTMSGIVPPLCGGDAVPSCSLSTPWTTRPSAPLDHTCARACASAWLVWMVTRNGLLLLHLLCHCCCDMVAEELLDLMKGTPRVIICHDSEKGKEGYHHHDNNDGDDPLLPRDCCGCMLLHFACASLCKPVHQCHGRRKVRCQHGWMWGWHKNCR